MAGPWNITNRPNAGSAATATQAAPGSGSTTGVQNRLRQLSASLAGSAAGTDQLVVRDGASSTGTIIWQWDLSVPVNGEDHVTVAGLDLRASVGNGLTIEFVNGVGSDRETVNASGDIVPVGYPMFQN